MHLCWDLPTAETVKTYAPEVAKYGIKYFVIDRKETCRELEGKQKKVSFGVKENNGLYS